MEVSVRPPKRHYDVIPYHCVSKLAYFVEHVYAINTPNFNALGCLDQILWKGVEATPLSATTR